MTDPFRVGDWIGGRFQIFDIHEGGMSKVYVVNDHVGGSCPKVVALKTLREELLRSRIRVSRFAAECRLWVQLGEHPNVVHAYSVEIIEGRPYVVLELIQGGDLNRWIGTPRLDLKQALRFGSHFCVGMEHAMRQGLHCHRDIKPGNLMVAENGTLKITDFGLARVCEEMVAVRPELPDGSIPLDESAVPQAIIWTDPRDWKAKGPASTIDRPSARPRAVSLARPVQPRPHQTASRSTARPPTPSTVDKETTETIPTFDTADPRLTRTGAHLGTGAYMAPEQFRDPKSVDVRADIYAFGVVLFEMITGELPFKGRSMDSLGRQHSLYQPPSIVPSVPSRHAKLAKSVDAIVQRCLKKEPSERFHAVAELRLALKAVLAQLR